MKPYYRKPPTPQVPPCYGLMLQVVIFSFLVALGWLTTCSSHA